MARKLRLTTKQSSVRGGYYKGTGSGAMGWHTKHGGYRIDPWKVRTYVVPAYLKNCEVCSLPSLAQLFGLPLFEGGRDWNYADDDDVVKVESFREQDVEA